MSQANKMTASQLLAQIEQKYFSGAGLVQASLLEGEERRAYRLAQVERLLNEDSKYTSWAVYLSDEFWTADEGRRLIKKPHPLLSVEGQQTLTADEMKRLLLIVEIAGLCHDLTLHFTFDLKEAFGFRNQRFWVTNRRLVEWLRAMEYEQIAVHTAYTLKRHVNIEYERNGYLPAQDKLAELYSSEHHCRVDKPTLTEMPPRDYVQVILDALQQIERHWRQGIRRKLNPELIMLHDEIYGVVPYQFSRSVLKAAQALYDYMDTEVCGRLVLKEYNYDAISWDDQPESVKQTTREVMTRFAQKVREVRTKYLAKGWVEDDSLEFSYLMAHAERCGQGWWREEDNAL